MKYQTLAPNIGTVYHGDNMAKAIMVAREYATDQPERMDNDAPIIIMGPDGMVKEFLPYEWTLADGWGPASERDFNGCWVRRGVVYAETEREAIRLARAAAGLTGVRGVIDSRGEVYGFCPYRWVVVFSIDPVI